MQSNPQEKLWTKSFVLLFLLSIITTFSFNMSMPVLPAYAVKLGATLTIAGTLSGIFSITALVVRPLSGIITDKFNNKYLLAISITITACTMIGYSLSDQVALLFVFRIIHGASFGVSSTVNIALASRLIPKSRLGEGLSLYGIAQILAMAVSPSIGLYISRNFGYSMCFLSSGIILIVALIVLSTFWYHPETKNTVPLHEKKKLSINNFIATESLVFACIGTCFSMVNGTISTYLVLYGESLGIKGLGMYYTVNALVLIASRFVLGKFIDKADLRKIIFPSIAAVILTLISFATAHSLVFILVAAVLYAFGQGTGQPAIQTNCIKQASDERRGVATSTYFLGADIGQGIGPVIGGAISQHFGYRTMFYIGILPMTVGVLLFIIHMKRQISKR